MIKKAYIQQTLRCHPDLFPEDPESNEKFKQLGEAFRVALQALSSFSTWSMGKEREGKGDPFSGEGSEDTTTQSALAALRRAMIDYHSQREKEALMMKTVFDHSHHHPDNKQKTANKGSSSSSSTDSNNSSMDDIPHEYSPFYTPSLEYIQHVCHLENTAREEIMKFCLDLPSMLSGKGALFETIAFFHTRYAAQTAACVSRFSKNLPVIVSRVVRQRKSGRRRQTESIKNTVKMVGTTPGAIAAAASGIGTSDSRHRTEEGINFRLEDMSMKPLVLMGALLFDVSSSSKLELEEREVSSSFPGITSPTEVKVCRELQCLIHPSDALGTIVDKIALWEQESFERLKLELAMSNVCTLLANVLGLEEASSSSGGTISISVIPHLESPHADVFRILTMLQKLAAGMCGCLDESLDNSYTKDEIISNVLVEPESEATQSSSKNNSQAAEQEEAPPPSHASEKQTQSFRSPSCWWWEKCSAKKTSAPDGPLPFLLALCRKLSVLAAPHLRGNVLLTWPKDVGAGLKEESSPSSRDAANHLPDPSGSFLVGRHPTCCVAEDFAFTLSLILTPDVGSFLNRWYAAFSRVLREAHRSQCELPRVLAVREAVSTEEFIPVTEEHEERGGRGETNETIIGESGGVQKRSSPPPPLPFHNVEDDENNRDPREIGGQLKLPGRERSSMTGEGWGLEGGRRYRHRPAVFTFPRVLNMNTAREGTFWRRIHHHREYLARHSPLMNPVNVFFNCFPYDPEAPPPPQYPGTRCAWDAGDDAPAAENRQEEPETRAQSAFTNGKTSNDSFQEGDENPRAGKESVDGGGESEAPHQDRGGETSHHLQDEGEGGWLGPQPHDPSVDAVVLTSSTLASPQAFKEWLEEVVTQSSLQRRIQHVLEEAGIRYVVRDRALPLHLFLSFVEVFIRASAVRSVLESRASSSRQGVSALDSQDVGLTIIVGSVCDVRDGGRLYVPWSMDPSVLVALLEDDGAETFRQIESRGKETGVNAHS